jgi:hypothetical protein
MSFIEEQNQPKVNSKSIQAELDLFEDKLKQLKIYYEQYFCNLIPLPPEKEHRELDFMSKRLLKLPFRNAQSNFRLKNLVLRFQTLNTHWERVQKQKEDGTYIGDKFKAKARFEQMERERKRSEIKGTKEEPIKQLFDSYKNAIEHSGLSSTNLDYDSFKKDIKSKQELLKNRRGLGTVSFRVESDNGRVCIKARKISWN